ncbi:hypothetical protein [Haloferula sp. A504]|uniref:hypothetical protein n=1 Tax=Haloferula sp. A504 TaxID=3373601 RepID=UPI0031C66942|nr:hypothetical protein [Verrucomicrobiaceae bacterium E54]
MAPPVALPKVATEDCRHVLNDIIGRLAPLKVQMEEIQYILNLAYKPVGIVSALAELLREEADALLGRLRGNSLKLRIWGEA